MAALYDGDGERIFRVDYRKNPEYVSNKGGTAENIYYNYSSSGIDYDHTMIGDEMLIPNGVDAKNSINYELTGYINDINSEYTQVLMEYGANQSITNVYEYGDQRNSATINGSKGYYLYDGRGSVASLAGNSGGNMVSYSYDAYGITTATSNTVNNPYQYNAEYTDSSTGSQYLRARYYEAANGRFLTKDTYLGTKEIPLSRNLYTYTLNNPLNYIDPSGHFGILATILIGAAVGALVSGGTNAITQKVTTGKVDWKQVGISAAVGAVGGAVGGGVAGGLASSFGSAAIGGGVTLTASQSFGIGMVSSVVGGSASRYADATLNNAVYGTKRNAFAEAFDPTSVAFDGLLGGTLGRLFHTGQVQYPLGNKPPQTKGQASTAKAWLEKLKKYCDDFGNPKVEKPSVPKPVDLPEEQLLQQADDIAKAANNATKHIDPPKATSDYDSILQDFANKADDIVNSDITKNNSSPAVKGTYKHTELGEMINALNDPHLKSEVTYLNGNPNVPRGTKGSIRLDVVEYNDAGQIVNIWDLKTGNAKFTDLRKQQILDDLIKNQDLLAPGFSIENIHKLTPNP